MEIDVKILEKHIDQRGILLEILKDNEITEGMKQVYFSISKPGVIRGNHYHTRKVEWFCVIKGKAKLYFEDKNTMEKKELIVSDDMPAVVRISPPYSHAIQNIGEDDMYLIIVANEVFDPKDTDTYKVDIVKT
jgi:UDP-2-acetamido-2,6-beta-L-arabino-hexul-4-ose reductase